MQIEFQQENRVSAATILVVAPAGLFREVIQSALQSLGHAVIGSCESLDQIVSAPEMRPSPDLLVVCGYGAEHPIELGSSMRRLRLRIPTAKWIFMGSDAASTLLREALDAGADGLLFDESPLEVVQSLISLVLLGHSFIPTPMARILSEHSAQVRRDDVLDHDALLYWDDGGAASKLHVDPAQSNSLANHPSRRVAAAPEERVQFDLTPREREILHWIALGMSNQRIAEMLEITSPRVKSHLKTLYRKMKVSNRSQAAIKALRYPTLPLSPSRN
jgi:two-component system, NarL family, nitrate/nitrite response regulator NarL